jgi:hypothetical protein
MLSTCDIHLPGWTASPMLILFSTLSHHGSRISSQYYFSLPFITMLAWSYHSSIQICKSSKAGSVWQYLCIPSLSPELIRKHLLNAFMGSTVLDTEHHSWPSRSAGSESPDSTNCRLQILRTRNCVRFEHAQTFFLVMRFPKQYSIATMYMVFTLYLVLII